MEQIVLGEADIKAYMEQREGFLKHACSKSASLRHAWSKKNGFGE
jgi:hypothetical protein